MADSGFDLTEELKAPSRPRRSNTWWKITALVLFGGYVISRIVSSGAKGAISIGILMGGILVLVAILLFPPMIYSGRRSGREGVLWKGLVSFHEDDVDDRKLFPQLVRTKRGGRGRQGLTGGRLEICDDGMRWKAGSIYTPGAEISGTFFLPWSDVHAIDVSYIPYKSKTLGGSITLSVGSPAREVGGEFLGRKLPLTGALEDVRSRISGTTSQIDP
jgi:hypothetical protein